MQMKFREVCWFQLVRPSICRRDRFWIAIKLYRCVTYGERTVSIDFGVAGSKVKVTVAKNITYFGKKRFRIITIDLFGVALSNFTIR